jgi:hypothetical protein
LRDDTQVNDQLSGSANDQVAGPAQPLSFPSSLMQNQQPLLTKKKPRAPGTSRRLDFRRGIPPGARSFD